MIYHIISRDKWGDVKDQNLYEPDSLEKEGFTHCSEKDQLEIVAEFQELDREKHLVLEIEEDKIKSEIKYEGETEEKFPHIYGPINLDAIEDTKELSQIIE